MLRAHSEMLPQAQKQHSVKLIDTMSVKKHASMPLDFGADRASSGLSHAVSLVRSMTAFSGKSVMSEDQVLALKAKEAAMQLKYESKVCLSERHTRFFAVL